MFRRLLARHTAWIAAKLEPYEGVHVHNEQIWIISVSLNTGLIKS